MDNVQFGQSVLRAHAVFQPGDGGKIELADKVTLVVSRPVERLEEFDPSPKAGELAQLCGEMKRWRENAHNEIRRAVERDRPADHRSVGVETTAPKLIGQDHHAAPAGLILIGQKTAPERRANT